MTLPYKMKKITLQDHYIDFLLLRILLAIRQKPQETIWEIRKKGKEVRQGSNKNSSALSV